MRHKAAVFSRVNHLDIVLMVYFTLSRRLYYFLCGISNSFVSFNRKYSSPCSSTRNNSRTLSLIDNDLQPKYLIFYGNVLCIITFFIYIIQMELNVQLFFNLSRARGSTIYYLNNICLSYVHKSSMS